MRPQTYERYEAAGNNKGNSRDGKALAKTIRGSLGPMPLAVRRDRNGTFEPQIMEKRKQGLDRFAGELPE